MFYTIRLLRKKDGSETKYVSSWQDHDSAEVHFHKTLAQDMVNPDIASVTTMVISENCVTYESRYWVASNVAIDEEQGGEF